MNKIISVIILLIVIIGGYFLFWHKSDDMNMPADTTTTDNTAATGATSGAAESSSASGAVSGTVNVSVPSVKTFTVTGSNFAFAPSALTVNKGDKVTIHFVNSGGNHDLVIDEFNAKTPVIGSGQSADVTFTADKTGTFDYYCSVGNHRQMGMQGVITVK